MKLASVPSLVKTWLKAVCSVENGKSQLPGSLKNAKLFKLAKVLMKISAPSICKLVSSFSLSVIPALSRMSCHSGFLSKASMSFISSSGFIFLYKDGLIFIISGSNSSVNFFEIRSVSRLLMNCRKRLRVSEQNAGFSFNESICRLMAEDKEIRSLYIDNAINAPHKARSRISSESML